jgi:hypothetical protein
MALFKALISPQDPYILFLSLNVQEVNITKNSDVTYVTCVYTYTREAEAYKYNSV